MKWILAILSLSMLLGCARKRFPQYLITQVRDTTIVQTEYRDSVIRVPAKQTVVTRVVSEDCGDFDTTVNRGKTTVQVSKKGTELKVICREDSLKMVIRGLNQKIDRLTSLTYEVPVPVEKRVPYIPKIIWWTIGILGASAIWGNRIWLLRLFRFIKTVISV